MMIGEAQGEKGEGQQQQTTRSPRLPPLPEELRRHICSFLPEIVDLVKISMVSKEWRGTARGYETKDRRPIFTDQAGVEQVWPHLPFGKVYGGEGRGMNCVRADGGYLYVGCRDSRARKVDVETGEVVWECEHGGGVECVDVDGGYLYTGSWDSKARKIDVETGEVVWECVHSSLVVSLHVCGGYLYTGCAGKGRKIDISTGEVVRECGGVQEHGLGVDQVHADGDYLYASCKRYELRGTALDYLIAAGKIDVSTGEVVWECDHHGFMLNGLHVHGDHLYTGCDDLKARKIEVETGEVLWAYYHGSRVCSVYACGGFLYTGCSDGKVRKIDVETGQVVWEHMQEEPVLSVHVDGGYLYTGCGRPDNKARRMLL